MPAPLNPIVCLLCRRGRQSLRAVVRRTVFVCAAFLLASSVATAQTLTTDQAVARARQQVPGKLVAVSKELQGNEEVYRVRILGADGVVRTVFVNANP